MLIKEYIITSPASMEVSVFVGYEAESGLLKTIRFEGAGPKKIAGFGKAMPFSEQRLKELADQYKWKLEPLDMDLSFAAFYDLYGNKVGKKRAESRWNKMKKEDKVKALLYIEKYKNLLKLRAGQQQMYPESYLNAEPWND